MKYKIITYLLLNLALVGILFLTSCKKKEVVDEIPPTTNDSVEVLAPIPTDNFAYLQEKIFAPTCANSGCHDGTFEPDFRTISSSYNSIVYQSVITNDDSYSFQYRVLPGNSAKSLLYERLINFIPNTSGIMPVVVDPSSDWNTKKTEYIQAIKTWIDNGAKDMYGNTPSLSKMSRYNTN